MTGAEEPTVKLSIDIRIHIQDDDVDTGYTLDRWNALTGEEREAVVQDIWTTMAGDHDDGGIQVVTPNATGSEHAPDR